MNQIDSIVTRLLALHPKRIDLTLERVWRILAALDHPERRLPPVIHVAGTNGKGSTVAFLRAILEAAGLRVHAYTSPHLVRFNERFRIGAVSSAGDFVSRRQSRARVGRSSWRCTTMSTMPWSFRYSARWKPSGSFSRMVCSITRGPAKPTRAPGSAIWTSPSMA